MERDESLKRKIEATKDDSDTSDNEIPAKRQAKEERVSLQHMPDQIMLEILKYLNALDLKSVGFVCERFARLISDRTLWVKVDCGLPIGVRRLHWMIHHGIGEHTKSVHITGFSKNLVGCGGHVPNRRPVTGRPSRPRAGPSGEDSILGRQVRMYSHPSGAIFQPSHVINIQIPRPDQRAQAERPMVINIDNLFEPLGDGRERPRPRVCIVAHPFAAAPPQRLTTGGSANQPQWPTYIQRRLPLPRRPITKCIDDLHGCPGPKFTITYPLLVKLRDQCPNLTSLSLEYCNINCETIRFADFPRKLKRLSLRGSILFNLSSTNAPFLHRIFDHMPLLEYINVSECSWLEPDYVMTLSKLEYLKELVIRDCRNMKDFIAYASLATRNGFKSLEILDYSGTPIGDSEVSPLGWLPNLTKLYLVAPPVEYAKKTVHVHYKDDPIIVKREQEPWEDDPPPYYPVPSETSLHDHKPDQVILKDDSYPDRSKKETPRQVYEIGEDYYVPCGYAYEREKLKDQYGVDFTNFVISESDSEEDEDDDSLPYVKPELNERPDDSAFQMPPTQVEYRMTYLVTDCGIRYFGQGENINIVHIGVHGRIARANEESVSRPRASLLKVLVCRGYRKVTDASLAHLLTAAPRLEYLDLRGTGVTRRGIENFRSLRPSVEVVWGE